MQTKQAAINALVNLILDLIKATGQIGISQRRLYVALTSIPGFLPCDLDVFLDVLEEKGTIIRCGDLIRAT